MTFQKVYKKEHRIHVGISKLSKMKAPQEAISKELEEYKQLLLEGFEDLRRKQDEIIQVAKAFSKQVNEANEVLAEFRTKNFLLEKQQTGTLTKSVSTQTVSTQTSVVSHSVGNRANSFWLSRDLTPQQNLETPTSATQASHHNTAESLDTFALQDLDTSTLWERCFQIIEKCRSQQYLPSCQNKEVWCLLLLKCFGSASTTDLSMKDRIAAKPGTLIQHGCPGHDLLHSSCLNTSEVPLLRLTD
nr:uncharacterized protein LOC103350878 isoform X1 [Oryctolagus cuniculus]XP_051676902.1 uncharacterized protein LOC103350878 isoform X1 [Oryctolagus cuniculus]